MLTGSVVLILQEDEIVEIRNLLGELIQRIGREPDENGRKIQRRAASIQNDMRGVLERIKSAYLGSME